MGRDGNAYRQPTSYKLAHRRTTVTQRRYQYNYAQVNTEDTMKRQKEKASTNTEIESISWKRQMFAAKVKWDGTSGNYILARTKWTKV